MRTNVHSNSIETHHRDPMYKQDKDAILEYSLKHRHFTTTMLARGISRPQSTLSSKVRMLLESGDLVKELDKHPCAITGNNAMYFYNPSYTGQLRLV